MGAVEAAVSRLRASLTPGQRQSAVILLALAVVVMAFGPPKGAARVIAAPVTPPRARPPAAAPAAAPPAAAVARPAAAVPLASPAPTPVIDTSESAFASTPSAGPAAPAVVALVRSGDTPLPGRDDASIAAVFLGHAGFPVTTVTYDPADATRCEKATSAGRIVLSSAGVDSAMRDCMVRAGVTYIAYDQLGDVPPASAGAGQVLSTSRGMAASLIDTALWGRAGALSGAVGVVSTQSAKSSIAPAVGVVKGLGVKVVDEAYLDDSVTVPVPHDVAVAALDFFSKGVSTVVFAAPVAFQTAWVAQATALPQTTKYVVSDAFDAVTNETYPATFDGAVAYTSVRGQWSTRTGGATPDQQACQTTWQTDAVPPTTLAGTETFEVYSWCQTAKLVAAALSSSTAPGDVFRTLTQTSPLTADLAPLDAGGWGPASDAVLVWSASCACWNQSHAFAPRPNRSAS